MRNRRVLLSAGFAIALVAGGGTALAAAASSGPVSGGAVSGCYTNAAVNGSHALVLQDAGATCPKGTTAVSWSQQGPAGPPGATGAVGPTGLTGAAGPAGPAGPGGPAGKDGATGSQGPAGPAGASNLDGLEGSACDIGSPDQGALTISYGQAGAVSFTCVPTALHALTLSVAGGDHNDTVVSSPAGIDCVPDLVSSACSDEVPDGFSVTLLAHPDGDDSFTGWSGGGCSGSASTCTVTLSADTSVTATFATAKVLTLAVTGGDGGGGANVGISGQNPSDLGPFIGPASNNFQFLFPAGSEVEIEAVPEAAGSNFTWGGACAGDTSDVCDVAMGTDETVTLTFNFSL